MSWGNASPKTSWQGPESTGQKRPLPSDMTWKTACTIAFNEGTFLTFIFPLSEGKLLAWQASGIYLIFGLKKKLLKTNGIKNAHWRIHSTDTFLQRQWDWWIWAQFRQCRALIAQLRLIWKAHGWCKLLKVKEVIQVVWNTIVQMLSIFHLYRCKILTF